VSALLLVSPDIIPRVSTMNKSVINDLISKSWVDTTHLPIQSTALDQLTDSSELYLASVVFSGTSEGSLTLATGEPLATKIASMMFECEIDAVSYDDIKDSIGELVNILAGNMKTQLFKNCDLSRPLVMQGNDAILSMLGSDVLFQETFISDDSQQLLIQICQTN
jgi:CheY-specific phosphatase CheX